MDTSAVLSALASVAASLVGFAGLLTAFRAGNETLRPYDVNNIRTLLIFSVSALVFALLPLPFASQPPRWMWPGLSILIGSNLLFWSVQSPRWMKRKGLVPRRPALYLGILLAQAVLAIGMIVGALVLAQASTLYAIGVLWFLVVALVVFVVQIFLLLPVDQPGSR